MNCLKLRIAHMLILLPGLQLSLKTLTIAPASTIIEFDCKDLFSKVYAYINLEKNRN
jgi:hypothetical protein